MTNDELSYFYMEEGALRSFTDRKSVSDVMEVIKRHAGKRDHIIENTFNLWQETLQWTWFDNQEGVRPTLMTWDVWSKENYATLRQCAYPDIKEQLAMQYDDLTNGTDTWLDMQNEIKARYPKL